MEKEQMRKKIIRAKISERIKLGKKVQDAWMKLMICNESADKTVVSKSFTRQMTVEKLLLKLETLPICRPDDDIHLSVRNYSRTLKISCIT